MLAAVIVAVSVYLAVKIYLGARPQAPVRTPDKPVQEGVDLSLEKLRFSEVKDGAVQWELVAERANHDRAKEVTFLTRPVMTVPPSDGHGPIRLDSDEAEYDNRTRDVRLRGNVRVTADKGAVFRTGRADYHSAASLITTSDRVRFQQPGLSVTGTGMELSTTTRNVRVLSAVEAVVSSAPRK